MKAILTRIKFYFVFKLNLNITPNRLEFQLLDKLVQLDWITRHHQDYEDIFYTQEGYLGVSYPQGIIDLEEYRSYPEEYDVAQMLANAGIEITESREEEINSGCSLTQDECEALTASIAENDVDSWIGHHGFEIVLRDGCLFTHFTGHSLGQGGIEFRYHSLFEHREALLDYIGEQFLASFQT